jgi:hypothetical protein
MSLPAIHRLRLVIQLVQVGEPRRSIYRLMAYPAPTGMSLRPATFSSREALGERLRTAIPGFEETRLGTGLNTQIIFAEDIDLTNAQIGALGLIV